jgi:hypothetical protein
MGDNWILNHRTRVPLATLIPEEILENILTV